MSYGPPNQPPPNFGQPPQQAGVPGPSKPSVQSKLLAPTGARSRNSLIVGAGAALLGVLLIVFSFLTWLSLNASMSHSLAGAGDMTMDINMTVNGVGSDSTDLDVSLPGGIPASVADEIQANAD